MSGWAPRRFWKSVQVMPAGEGFAVSLDNRPLKTPGKADFIVPTREMAAAAAAEWEAQGDTVRPQDMPVTRTANTAIDALAVNHAAVVEEIARYGETDLLCYRAVAPQALRARQEAAWEPLLCWAEAELDAPLLRTVGVMHVPQPAESLSALRAEVDRFTAFGLAGLHDLVALSGSLVIGLAAVRQIEPAEVLWVASRVDEIWQAEQWGSDEEAEAMAARKCRAFLEAARFLRLCGRAGQNA
jgi:chaperone required for assembly of F1-ATPase